MKVDGNGQGKVLTATELKRLFSDGLISERDRCLFAICLFTGCRISEALALQKTDIKNKTITFRKSTTKGKLKTRTIDTPAPLIQYLAQYSPPPNPYNPYLFPSREGKPLTRFMADKILRAACTRIGVEGVSTHSFRRTALTQMCNAGIPLRHIQEISGHNDLGTLQRYLEVSLLAEETRCIGNCLVDTLNNSLMIGELRTLMLTNFRNLSEYSTLCLSIFLGRFLLAHRG